MPNTKILAGDCIESLKKLPNASVNCCVTSPPYFGLRDYGCDGQIGLEETPEEFVAKLVAVFREVKRVLKDDGTCWVNMGDSYAGSGKGRNPDGTVHVSALIAKQGSSAGTVMGNVKSGIVPYGCKPKDLIGIPWMLAFALRADGWYLRQDIIWHKPNPMPESVTDRCTKAHEYIFLLSKSRQYYFDSESIKTESKSKSEGVRFGGNKYGDNEDKKFATKSGNVSKEYTKANKRSVWSVNTHSYREAHFATYPPDLIKPCIIAGCPEGGVVIDPFGGSGTTAQVAMENGRNAILCELNPEYVKIIEKRLSKVDPLFNS
jgi:site-specific DNA-methyltransferase (adenine-specific)